MQTQFHRYDIVKFEENQFDGTNGVVIDEIPGSSWVVVHVNKMPVLVEKSALSKQFNSVYAQDI